MSNTENDPGAEKLLLEILQGEPEDPKCPTCGLTETGCAMCGCGAWANIAIDDSSDLDKYIFEEGDPLKDPLVQSGALPLYPPISDLDDL